ncbi:MAG: hypothetical protein ACOC1F_10805 [Myxococcota bacterium]
MTDEYMELRCRCGQRFCVCLQCYHGEAYCCRECAAEGYRAVQQEARARHQSSQEGKEDHRDLALDFGTAASRVDEPVREVEERADVTTICDRGPLRPWPVARPVSACGPKGEMASQ